MILEIQFEGLTLRELDFHIVWDLKRAVGNITESPDDVELQETFAMSRRREDSSQFGNLSWNDDRSGGARRASGVAVSLRVRCADDRDAQRKALLVRGALTRDAMQDMMRR